MKRLLLLALPALLAGCPKPRDPANDSAAPAPPMPTVIPTQGNAVEPAAKAPTEGASQPDDFTQVAVVHAAAMLPRHQWRIIDASSAEGGRIDTLLPSDKPPVTLAFKGGQVAVGNTCNAMSGSYGLKGRTLLVGTLASTQKACADPQLAILDREVAQRLAGSLSLRLSKADPLQLELTTASGDVIVFTSAERARANPGEPALKQGN